MTDVTIRLYQSADLEALKRLTVAAFDGVTLEQNIENALGLLHGHDWQWRKSRHVDEDVAANPAGVFVAEINGQCVGYISTRIDAEVGRGRILGRRLIERALEYFRQEGLEYAIIETMAQNQIGQHLYPACGFVEVARQVHFVRRI